MRTKKFGNSSAIVTALTSVLFAGLGAFGCSSDGNNGPSRPPVVIGDEDSGTRGGAGNGGSATGGGRNDAGGGGNGGGGDDAGGGAGGAASGGTDGGTAGAGGSVDGGSGGAPPCDPNVTGSNPPGCFQCVATTHEQFLNHCTDSQCSAFDATRLPSPLPSPTW